jgi:uncharacterized small protein (DUF1192 family)
VTYAAFRQVGALKAEIERLKGALLTPEYDH